MSFLRVFFRGIKSAFFVALFLFGIIIILSENLSPLISNLSSDNSLYSSEVNHFKNTYMSNASLTLNISENKENCKLPKIPIWPKYFQKWNPKNFVHDCSYEKNLAVLNGTMLVKIPAEVYKSCCLHEILRGNKDTSFRLTDCQPFVKAEDVSEKEVIVVKCGHYINAYANIPEKPNVKEKIEYWEGFSDEEKPYSVFILGIDTVSRPHAYRSLPETMKWLKKLGFVDFKTFHSLAPSTLPNFSAMLMGLSQQQVRGSCSKSWASPFDKCPFIWKNFSENYYVTGYVEDGLQTFNWGGMSGFRQQPTDYYLHHLFVYLRKRRTKINHQRKLSQRYSIDCTSKETVPNFMVQYTKKWLKKFKNTPFFFMNWFEDPFHQDINALPNFDSSLSEFFKFFSLQPDLLRKSFFVLVSDHGDRMNQFFNGRSIESFFERSQPALFIRLPNQLRQQRPDIFQTLKDNSAKLVTPYDIHHSLVHAMLINSNLNIISGKFDPRLNDRCSLFEDIPSNRTCESTKIPSTHCLCNLEFKGAKNIPTSSNLVKNMLRFSIENLNYKISSNSFSHLCSAWESWSNNVTYARYISKSELYNEAVIVFVAYPGKAKFEARLKFLPNMDSESFNQTTQLVGLSRINVYGDLSWCLPTVTDVHKEMKEFCTCRVQRQKSAL